MLQKIKIDVLSHFWKGYGKLNAKLEKELNLPATDPFRFGAEKLVNALASIT